ncbi:MAG: hypothetical protein GY842_06405 [bacterium]|nr:hypothetical protein [bacterium]
MVAAVEAYLVNAGAIRSGGAVAPARRRVRQHIIDQGEPVDVEVELSGGASNGPVVDERDVVLVKASLG